MGINFENFNFIWNIKGHTRQAISEMKFNLKKNTNSSKIKNISKIFKTKENQQPTNSFLPIELRNPDSPSLMEIRRSKVKPYRAPSKIKIVFIGSYFFFAKSKHYENHAHFYFIQLKILS